MRYDILIHGSGIVSRVIALLLASQRLRVGLSQRPAATGQPDIRAYALNDASRLMLQRLRVWPAEREATPVTRMRVHGDSGGEVDFDAAGLGASALAWIVDVPALESRLEDAVGFQPLVERLDPAAMEASHADLRVICEGKASRLRDALGVGFEPQPYGQQALAARLVCEKPHEGVAWQWFSGGEILALLPLDGPQGNLMALVWSIRDSRADALMGLQADAFCEELRQACGSVLGSMTLAGERGRWPLKLAQASRMAGKGWVLAGDAAHAVHPLAGQGLNLGLGDAADLARIIGGREDWRSPADPRLLREYERCRRVEMATRGRVSDRMFHLFAHGDSRVQALRNLGMNVFDRIGPVKRWTARQAMGMQES